MRAKRQVMAKNSSTKSRAQFCSFSLTASTGLFGAAPAGGAVPEAAMLSAPPMADLAYQSNSAEHHALSTTFHVPSKKTIPSDNSEHKVTIVTLELTPMLHFDCVASKSTNVYLTASLINSSAYPLLAGNASVYVDNSFSTKASWPATTQIFANNRDQNF